MAFIAGYNTKIYVSGYDLSGFFNNYDLGANVDLADVTTFCKTQRVRKPTIADGSVSLSGFSDNAAGGATNVINASIQQENKVYMVYPAGDTIGNYGHAAAVDVDSISQNAPFDGITTYDVTAQSNNGLDFIISLHDLSAETSAGSATSHDHGAVPDRSTGAGYLQVSAFTGTNIDIIIEESTTNAFAGEETTLLSFTSVTTANTAERAAFTTTPDRYLRATWTGTFTTATFNVGVDFT